MRASLTGQIGMNLVLPLDVVADKLRRIEDELRHLNMKALNFDAERDSGELEDLIEVRLERIRDTISSIGSCLTDLSSDIQPRRAQISAAPLGRLHTIDTLEESDAPFERAQSELVHRKPQPDRDD